jgi:hypothetical protein
MTSSFPLEIIDRTGLVAVRRRDPPRLRYKITSLIRCPQAGSVIAVRDWAPALRGVSSPNGGLRQGSRNILSTYCRPPCAPPGVGSP